MTDKKIDFFLEEYKSLRSMIEFLNARLQRTSSQCVLFVSLLCLMSLGAQTKVLVASVSFSHPIQRIALLVIAFILILYFKGRYNKDHRNIVNIDEYLSSKEKQIFGDCETFPDFMIKKYTAKGGQSCDNTNKIKSKNWIWRVSFCFVLVSFLLLIIDEWSIRIISFLCEKGWSIGFNCYCNCYS